MSEEFVLYEQTGAVVTLTLNNPDERNALSTQAQWDAIVDACDRIQADNSVKAVVLTGAGSAFCAGGNVHHMKARSGMIEGGTAVGMGLATAINRLRESTRKSRVIILMTDGVNNRGMIQPLDAARIAQQYGIRVYTIGVGSRGKALSPVAQGPNGQYQYAYVDVEIDDDMMKQVADLTGGTYFRATDEGKLKDVYEQIDKLEKTREKITRYSRHSDKYFKPLFAGCSLLVLGLLLDKTLFRTTP